MKKHKSGMSYSPQSDLTQSINGWQTRQVPGHNMAVKKRDMIVTSTNFNSFNQDSQTIDLGRENLLNKQPASSVRMARIRSLKEQPPMGNEQQPF